MTTICTHFAPKTTCFVPRSTPYYIVFQQTWCWTFCNNFVSW